MRRYEQALHQLQCYTGDPVATVEVVAAERPDFAMGHAFYLGDARMLRDRLTRALLGQIDEVLALFDGPVFGGRSALDLVDAKPASVSARELLRRAG